MQPTSPRPSMHLPNSCVHSTGECTSRRPSLMRTMRDLPPTSMPFQMKGLSAAHTPVVIGVKHTPCLLLHVLDMAGFDKGNDDDDEEEEEETAFRTGAWRARRRFLADVPSKPRGGQEEKQMPAACLERTMSTKGSSRSSRSRGAGVATAASIVGWDSEADLCSKRLPTSPHAPTPLRKHAGQHSYGGARVASSFSSSSSSSPLLLLQLLVLSPLSPYSLLPSPGPDSNTHRSVVMKSYSAVSAAALFSIVVFGCVFSTLRHGESLLLQQTPPQGDRTADPSMEKILKDATKIEKVRKTAQNLRRALEAAEKSKSTRVHQQQVSREINMLEDKLRRVASSEGLDSAVKQVVGEKQDVREQEEARRKNVPLRVIKREKKASEEPRDNSWLVAPKQDQWGQEVARGKRKMIGYYDYGVHQQEPAWKYHPKIKQDTIDFRKEEKQFAKLPADSSWNLLPSSRPHAWTVAPPSSDAGARKTREHMAPAAGRAVKEEGARREVKAPQARSSLASPPSSPSFSSPSSTSPVRSDERLDGPLARTAANLKMLMREAMRSKDVPAVASAAPALGDVSLRSSLKRMNQDFDLEAQAERRVQEQLSSFDGLGGSGEREAPAGF
eukprot:759551-Hanusia_phi.AAC.1